MRKHRFWITIFISFLCVLYLRPGLAWGQTFPQKPTMRLGKGILGKIAYSPDGSLLAVGSSLGVWLYSARELTEVGLLEGHTAPVFPVAFSPDSKILASGGQDNTVRLWDVQTQKQVGILVGHTNGVYPIAFSPDGQILASGSWDKTIRLWDVQAQKQIGMLEGHIRALFSIAFSPDGKTLASGNWETTQDHAIRLWDVQAQKQIGMLEGHANAVSSIVFSPDGKTLASGSWDRTVRIWDVERQKQVGILEGYTNGVSSIAFRSDSQILALGIVDVLPIGNIHLWDVKEQKPVAMLKETHDVNSVAFSPDGKILVAAESGANKIIRMWDVQTQKQIGMLEGHTGDVLSISFSPDGKILASGSRDKTIRLWNVEGQRQIGLLEGHTSGVRFIVFSPNGQILASVGEPHRIGGDMQPNPIRLWDVQAQKQVGMLEGHPGSGSFVVFSPDGQILAFGIRNSVHLWSIQQQNLIGVLSTRGWASAVTFSPDGKILASSEGGDYTAVRLWDVQAQKQIGVSEDHKSGVTSVVFSPDGKWLASGSRDGTVLLWELNLPVPVPVEPKGKLPTTFGEIKRTMLLQNYPNPFNPETWIPYQLSEDTIVRIRIYDSQGKMIRQLDLGLKFARAYLTKETAAYWDGRNELGEAVASGLYFYRLDAGDFTAIRRMILFK